MRDVRTGQDLGGLHLIQRLNGNEQIAGLSLLFGDGMDVTASQIDLNWDEGPADSGGSVGFDFELSTSEAVEPEPEDDGPSGAELSDGNGLDEFRFIGRGVRDVASFETLAGRWSTDDGRLMDLQSASANGAVRSSLQDRMADPVELQLALVEAEEADSDTFTFHGIQAQANLDEASATGFIPVMTGGFGDPNNVYAWSLKSFNGYLYSGTAHLASTQDGIEGSAELWRYDGTDWEQITDTGFGNLENTGIRNLVEYRGRLYAAVVNGDEGAEIWRSRDGEKWQQVASGGLGDPGNEAVRAMFEFKGKLFVGTQDTSGGVGELYVSRNGKDWTEIISSGFGWPGNDSIHDLYEFDGYLYASVRNDESGAQIWRSTNGKEWDQIVGPYGTEPAGFGLPANVLGFQFMEFKGQLYIATGNVVTGFGVYRSSDGLTFDRVGEFGFGDPDNIYGWRFHVFEDQLWFGTTNGDVPSKGGSVWRSDDGVDWEEMVGGNGTYAGYGFDNPLNWGIRSFETYDGDLYIGTANLPFGPVGEYVNGSDIYMWEGTVDDALIY